MAKLVSARTLSPSVRELGFEREDGPLAFAPGQWLNVFQRADGDLKRSYSIASAPRGDARFDLAVTLVPEGPMSPWLHQLPLGSSVRCVGPSGLFTRDANDARPALFVGTGTGMAPLRSMVDAALAAQADPPRLGVLFGFRHEQDVLYPEDLERWRARGVRVDVTLSQPRPDWAGRRGYVQAHLQECALALAPASDLQLYVCGLDRMIKAVRELAKGPLGLGRKQIQHERFD